MELTVLVENTTKTDYYLLAEPALSFYLENDYQKVLFDCGYSDVFIKNAYKMGIDLTEVNDVVLSHGHDDHTGGLIKLDILYRKMLMAGVSLNHKALFAMPEIFDPKLNEDKVNIGAPYKEEDLCNLFDVEYTIEPKWLTPHLLYLGEIPKNYPTDYVYNDETALVFKGHDGLTIISGCCHTGVRNLIEHAQRVTGEERIENFIGGIHLVGKSEYKIREIGIYLKSLNIKNFYPCHCCDLNAKIILSEYIKPKEVYTGMKLHFQR